jgi:hypothetical protein
MSSYNVVDVVEIPKLLREYIKKKYPNYKFSVTRTNYNSIDVDLLEADFDAFISNLKYTNVNPFYIQNDSNLTDVAKKVMQDIYDFLEPNELKFDDGYHKNYNFYLTLHVGTYQKPYKKIDKKSYPSKSGFSSSTPQKYDKGTLITTCGGWELFKATTKNGKVVYNAYKLASTPLNKLEWNVIKGDIYTQSGFKYQYNAFTKWGEIDDKRIDRLCELLDKYYKSQGTGNVPTTTPTPKAQTTTQLLTTPKVLDKKDIEIRIKGIETLLKYATDQAKKDDYNIRLNGLRTLLKYSKNK